LMRMAPVGTLLSGMYSPSKFTVGIGMAYVLCDFCRK
jgi:hypothetical protein